MAHAVVGEQFMTVKGLKQRIYGEESYSIGWCETPRILTTIYNS